MGKQHEADVNTQDNVDVEVKTGTEVKDDTSVSLEYYKKEYELSRKLIAQLQEDVKNLTADKNKKPESIDKNVLAEVEKERQLRKDLEKQILDIKKNEILTQVAKEEGLREDRFDYMKSLVNLDDFNIENPEYVRLSLRSLKDKLPEFFGGKTSQSAPVATPRSDYSQASINDVYEEAANLSANGDFDAAEELIKKYKLDV